MSSLSMMEARLPPGFRFHPRDDELVCDYLAKKVAGVAHNSSPTLIDVDLNKCEPWDLPEVACVGGKEWYLFSLRARKYVTGQRTNRSTLLGYWKATGKDQPVLSQRGLLVGMRKTLVFYLGRAPKGRKTDWLMHEFRMEEPAPGPVDPLKLLKEDWALCRVFYKSRGSSSLKRSIEHCYADTSSSKLPSLPETYIASDQTAQQSLEGFEQVPCFSNLSLDPASHHHMNQMPASPIMSRSTHLGGLLEMEGSCSKTLFCHQRVIKSVQNHDQVGEKGTP